MLPLQSENLSFKDASVGATMMSTSHKLVLATNFEIEHLSVELRNAGRAQGMFDVLQNFEVQRNLGQTCTTSYGFFYKGFTVDVSSTASLNVNAENLEFANQIGIRSGPKLIELITQPDGSQAMVCELPGCRDAAPMRFSDWRKGLSAEARSIVEKDIVTFAKQQLYSPRLTDDTSSWLVSQETGHIFVTNLSLRPITADDRGVLSERIANLPLVTS